MATGSRSKLIRGAGTVRFQNLEGATGRSKSMTATSRPVDALPAEFRIKGLV